MHRGRYIVAAALTLLTANVWAAEPVVVLNLDFAKAEDQAKVTLNGSAEFVGPRLQLTSDTKQIASAWTSTPLPPMSDYLATMQFEVRSLDGADPADGFVFAIQTHDAYALGGGGGYLGYAGIENGSFIGYTYGFEVNTYAGQGVQGVAFDAFGGRPKISQRRWPDAGGKLVDRGIYTMQVRVTPDTGATVIVAGGKNNMAPKVAWSSPPYLNTFFNAPTDKPFFVGFTASTGGLGTIQEILNLRIVAPAPPASPGN
jgi:hypothetical protein